MIRLFICWVLDSVQKASIVKPANQLLSFLLLEKSLYLKYHR